MFFFQTLAFVTGFKIIGTLGKDGYNIRCVMGKDRGQEEWSQERTPDPGGSGEDLY